MYQIRKTAFSGIPFRRAFYESERNFQVILFGIVTVANQKDLSMIKLLIGKVAGCACGKREEGSASG
jgi:hypothetical protein